METRRQLTLKFIIGMVMIAVSLLLGKLVLIPIVLFPNDNSWRFAMIVTYIFSWVLILIGIVLAGTEGYKLAKLKYNEYGKKTMTTVREQGRRAAHGTRRAAQMTVDVLKNPKQAMKRRR